MKGFEKRNPNLKVFNAVMHLDEATPHLHIDFVPFTRNTQKGLSVKVSMKGALREQGFSSANRLQNEWAAWEESEFRVMTDILHRHDLSRDVKNVHRAHLTVDDYKQYAAQKNEVRKINEQINELKKKNPADLTAAEIELIKNQNDIMRSEIQKRDEKISSLSRKLGAKFVPLEIFSEDKLQYVADELSKANVPFVEENNALHIPDYAQKTAAAIAAAYKPNNSNGIRDRIRLDIDRLVYCSVNLDNFYNKLRERGYQIKNGKHIAVKPTFAERFVRLKTLGEAYFLKNLEQRIADRDIFPNSVREKFKTANPIEKNIQVTVLNIIGEIKKFRLAPRKIELKKIYTFKNDAEINYLSEQLCTIQDFNFSTREQIYSKAEELKLGIDEKTAKLKQFPNDMSIKDELSDDRVKLKRVSDLINAYESIVEGNYIDNLVRSQERQNKAPNVKQQKI